MSDAITGTQIGSVVSLTGSVWAISGSSQRPLTAGAPVYKGEEIVTETDSNVEIKFTDNTVLGQGADSAVRLDDYVFTGDDGSLDFHMVKGVLRVVSGEIVKANPENFNLTTPMATIGIRGTEVMVQIDHDREFIGVDKMGEGHTVVVSTAFNQVIIDKAGMFSGIDFDGSLIAPDEMPASFISTIIRAAPLTTLGDPPRSPGDPQDVTPPQVFETIDNQTGEYKPGVGQEPAQGDDGDEDEPIQLTDAEIDALLAMETAAGGDDGVSGEPLGQVVDLGYEAYDPGTGADVVIGTSFDDGQGGDDGDRDTPDDDSPPPAPTDGTDNPTPIEGQTVIQDAEAENTPVTHNVLDGTPETTLVAAALAQDSVLQGAVTFDAQGTITYVPVPGEEGTALVDYTVEDAEGTVSSALLTIELATDSAPSITADDAIGTDVDGVVIASGTIAADFGADSDGSSLALSAADATWNARSGTLIADDQSWAVTLTGTEYEFTQYGPLATAVETAAGTPLSVEITVTAVDSDGDTATESFSVALVDDSPEAHDATTVQATEDTIINYNVITEGDVDTGLYGGSLVAAELADSGILGGAVTFVSDGTITYSPAAGETGTVLINYAVEDADGDTAMAQLAITLAPDSQPVITRSNVSGDETDGLVTLNGTLSVDFGADAAGATVALAADGATWDGESLTANDGSWAIQTDAAGYTFTQYDPLMHADLSDPDDPYAIIVTVTATDGDNSVTTGSFTITVDDDGPTATDASFIQDTAPDTATSYNIFTQGDASLGMDAGALTGAALAADSPYEGTVTYRADGTITYTPVEGEIGTVTIDYMVTDGDGDTASAQLSIDLAQEPSEYNDYLPGQGGDTLTGGEGDDTLDGGTGRDVIFGTGGDDELIGGNSKDAILGGNGNDILDGGKGNDLLIGGMGDDVLTGGKGSDTFAFTSPDDGMDSILDFQTAVDTIALYNSGFNFDSDNGTLDVNQFAVVEAEVYEGGIDFAGANSGLIYASPTDCSAGTLYFDPNDTLAGDEIVLATIQECDGSNLVADDIDIV